MGRECYTISVSKHIKPCHVTPCHAISDITTYLIITISTKFKFTDHADSKYRRMRISKIIAQIGEYVKNIEKGMDLSFEVQCTYMLVDNEEWHIECMSYTLIQI